MDISRKSHQITSNYLDLKKIYLEQEEERVWKRIKINIYLCGAITLVILGLLVYYL